MRPVGVALGFLLSITAAPAQQYVLSTIAGGVPPPTPALGTSMPITEPRGIATDVAGNVYFTSLHCVFKLDRSGVVTRVAGNSARGYSGDGGAATNAQLNYPIAIAVDRARNLFIMDSGNGRARKVSPNGIITTVAGGGSSRSADDGGPATEMVAAAGLTGTAVDGSGNLFIADYSRIRKVSLSGIITTVAGGGHLSGDLADGGRATEAAINPGALAVDTLGNVFFTDFHRVRKVSSDGIITTAAGSSTGGFSGDGGPATSAQLFAPQGVALDRTGNLLIADWSNLRIRKVSPGGIISTLAGSGTAGFSGDGGPAASAQLDRPAGVAVDEVGNVFITDLGNSRIRKVATSGIISTVAGNGGSSAFSGDNGPATIAQLSNPTDVFPDAVGNLFIVDYGNRRIRKISPNGIITTVLDYGKLDFPRDGLPVPTNAKANAAGELFLADPYHDRILKLSKTGTVTTIAGGGTAYPGDGGPAISAALRFPTGIAVDSSGNLLIADWGHNRVRMVSANGLITTVAGTGSPASGGDGGLATNASLFDPSGVALDSSGNLFIAEWGSRRIRRVAANGIITTAARTTARPNAGSVTVDAAGSLFFLDVDGVRKVSPNGAITKVAGGGTCWPCNGVPATSAAVFALGLAADDAGNVYVADTGNNAVRVLRPTNHSLLIGAVVDAASQSAIPLSPGKLVVIYGAGLGPSQLTQPTDGPPGTLLDGTTAAFNGIAATILYTSATQVAAVVPYALTGTTAQVTVTYQGETSAAFSLPVAPSAPSFFTSNQTGAGQAAAINVIDATINTAVNPVKIGGYISLYATGEGQTMVTPGGLPPRPILPVTVTIGGIPATVQYAGGAPGQVAGLMQVNVQIPAGVEPGGYVPVVLQVGDASTTDGAVWIAVAGN